MRRDTALATIILLTLSALQNATGQKTFWGDLHAHSAYSLDAIGPIDSVYARAKRVAKLDFICVTDHDHSLSTAEWEKSREYVQKYYQPGSFVTFSGYEFTSFPDTKWGHTTVLFRGLNGPFWSASFYAIYELFDFIKNEQVVLGVAHPDLGIYSSDTSYYNGQLQRTIEVYGSNKQRFEYWGNPAAPPQQTAGHSVQDRLIRGKIFGFTAVSDDHSGNPGKVGLTAIIADTLTRDALFYALKDRRCYATTGARIGLAFECNDQPMGSVIVKGVTTHFSFSIAVKGTDKLTTVEVVKNNNVHLLWRPRETDTMSVSFSDTDTSRAFYYVRVTQENGHIAWSSPIYVNVERGDRSITTIDSNELRFQVGNSYPNPFNQGVVIPVTVPTDLTNNPLTLDFYNISGQRVRRITRQSIGAGEHLIRWNGTNDRDAPLPSGTYYYVLHIGTFHRYGKLVMVK